MAEPKKEDKPKKSLSDAVSEIFTGNKVSADATDAEMTNKLESLKETGTPEQVAAMERQIEIAKKKKEAAKGAGTQELEK